MVYGGQLYIYMPDCGGFADAAYYLSGIQYILAYLLIAAEAELSFMIV